MIANSGGRTDGIDGTDEIDGSDGTAGIDGTGTRIATDPMQSLLPGSWLCFLSKGQRTLKNPGNIYRKSRKHKLRIFQDHSK